MAHMIENNMLAYVGAEPWHGLGVKVNSGTTGAEMLTIAGLDWDVEERDVYVATSQNDDANELCSAYKAIVRADTGRVFSIPSKRYEIVQNAEVVDLFSEYCEAGHATMETVGGLRGGAVVWALAKLNGGSEIRIKGSDTVSGYVLFCTSHDGSMPTLGKATQVRVVCHNTLTAAVRKGNGKGFKKYDAQFKMKHSSRWTESRKAQAQMQMELATESAIEFNSHCARLADVTLTNDDTISFIHKLLDNGSILDTIVETQQPTVLSLDDVIAKTENPGKELSRVGAAILDSIINSPGSDLDSTRGTLWGVVNGVSHYVDHTRGRSQDARLQQGWFGVGDELKTQAVTLALAEAGIA